MKKTIILAVLVALAMPSMAQKKGNVFSIDHDWTKIIGYSYQPGYHYGISLAGGSFLSFGFAEEDARYDMKKDNLGNVTEYREPTWSLRCGWIGYSFDKDLTGWGAVSFRPMLVMGIDRTKDAIFDASTNTWTKENNTYFTMAPTVVVNLWMVHFSVGYEIVPKFKDLNGINFGVGFSIPASTDKLEQKAKNYQQNRKSKSKSKKK